MRAANQERSTMKMVDIFETRIEEKIDPVIKVGEVQDEAKLASEFGSYVVTPIIERYVDEFLTGERRTFEDEVATLAARMRQQDREAGLAKHFVYDPDEKKHHLQALLGVKTVEFKGVEFDVRISMDGTMAAKAGDIEVRFFSPLAALGGVKVTDLEDQSLRTDEQNTIFVLCDRIPGFDQGLDRFLAMREVIHAWKGDSRRSEDARALAQALDRLNAQRRQLSRSRDDARCSAGSSPDPVIDGLSSFHE